MKHFAFVLYVGLDAQRNLCDKQNVLFCGTHRTFGINQKCFREGIDIFGESSLFYN